MRFLVDECTGPGVTGWLRSQGHETCSMFDESRGMEDDEVLQKAHDESWILITNDKDLVRRFIESVARTEASFSCVLKMNVRPTRLKFYGGCSKVTPIE